MIKKVLIIFFLPLFVYAQDGNPDYPWQRLFADENISVKFIFYSKADNSNNGVVIKLENKLAVETEFSFRLIFKSLQEEKSQIVSGLLKPNEIITGSSRGLFFIPFPDGKSISELGITDIKIGIINLD